MFCQPEGKRSRALSLAAADGGGRGRHQLGQAVAQSRSERLPACPSLKWASPLVQKDLKQERITIAELRVQARCAAAELRTCLGGRLQHSTSICWATTSSSLWGGRDLTGIYTPISRTVSLKPLLDYCLRRGQRKCLNVP